MNCFRCSVLLVAQIASAYSVLTHEAIIDSAWDESLKPLLLRRFPRSTPDELKEAHAYAYGGCIIQDMGYYPLSSKLFSDLTHYARSGDFVAAMLRSAADRNEYAFALGALAHYTADNSGHPYINRAVPVLYPKLARKYGEVMTYEDNPAAHMKAEFGFDVLQVARGLYPQQAYHDFIGFQVAKPVVERAFLETYGIELKEILFDEDLAFGTYRFAVARVIPEITKTAWNLKEDDIRRILPGITRGKFLYNLSRAGYEQEWDGAHDRPGIGARILAWFLRIVPKVGPLKPVSFRPPTNETEQEFLKSFNVTVDNYRRLLTAARAGRLNFEDYNLDVGRPTHATQYRLADQAYARLLDKLAAQQFRTVTPAIRRAFAEYFSARKPAKRKTRARLAQLLALRSSEAAGR